LLTLLVSTSCIGDPPEAANLSPEQHRTLQQRVQSAAPATLIRHSAQFGSVELLGYTLEPRTLTHRAGSKLEITLVWRCNQPLPSGYVLFTHLLSPQGKMLANLDSQGPLRSMPGVSGVPLPPSRWLPGFIYLDDVTVTLPPDAPEQVRIATGFYRGDDRIPATGTEVNSTLAATVLKLRVVGARAHADTAPPVPELTVPRRSQDAVVNIDGVLDEPVWEQAGRTSAFVHPTTGKADPQLPVQGHVRVLYDAEALYLGFEVSDVDVRGGFSADEEDPHLWTGDTVELMIDPDGDGDGRDYYELQINPQNLVFDSAFDSYNQPRGGPNRPFGHESWRSAVTSAVRIDGTLDDKSDHDGGYVVEARLPFASLTRAAKTPPDPGDRWRMNFYALQNNGGAAWSPILGQGNFHRASRFGRVLFSANTVP